MRNSGFKPDSASPN